MIVDDQISSLAMRASQIGFWDWNPQTSETFVSETWCRIMSVPVEQAAEAIPTPHETLHPDDRESLYSAIKKHFDGEGDLFEHSHRLLRADGEWQWVLERGGIVQRDEGGDPVRFVAIMVPIDEVKKTESQHFDYQARLAASAKLTALGEMAGGIAHEINNPLAVIDGHAYRCQRIVEAPTLDKTRLAEAVEKIRSTVERIKKIVSSLRTLSRNTELDTYEKVDIREVLQDVLGLIGERTRNHGISLEVVEDLVCPSFVLAQRVSLAQVFLNLVSNAFDAVDGQDGGYIRIEIKSIPNEVLVRVCDSGPGVPESIILKIFDPFFTTKQVGKGTGLGLSLSKTIVEKHGGQIGIDKNYKDTCFIVRLPSAESPWSLEKEKESGNKN